MNRDQYRQLAAVTNTHGTGSMPSNRYVQACNCIGPQDGRPLCPCMMRGVVIRDGRYIKPEQDLGPVVAADQPSAMPDLRAVVLAHVADLERCIPTLIAYRMMATAEQFQQAIAELRRAADPTTPIKE